MKKIRIKRKDKEEQVYLVAQLQRGVLVCREEDGIKKFHVSNEDVVTKLKKSGQP